MHSEWGVVRVEEDGYVQLDDGSWRSGGLRGPSVQRVDVVKVTKINMVDDKPFLEI